LVAEFGTDYIEKAVYLIPASIFSENVGEMKLKVGEEIEQNVNNQHRRHSGEMFSILAIIPV